MFDTPKPIQFIESMFKECWWVLLFSLICFLIYEQGLKQIKKEYSFLHEKYQNLHNELEDAMAKSEELKLQIKSQNNPEWIELILMKELGLVPKGQTKVVFKHSR